MTRRNEKTFALAEAALDLARRPLQNRGKRHADTDDMVQDAAVRALQLDAPEAIREPRRYLFRVLRNLFLDRSRQRIRESIALEDPSLDASGSDPVDPERILAGKQQLKIALAAIDALPPRCGEAFRLHRFEEMSYPAIARHMGISVSMVEKHMSEAMRKIAAALREEAAS